MRTYLIILLGLICNTTVYSQEYSSKTVTVGDNIFLPYMKGKVVNRIPQTDINSKNIFAIIQSQTSINTPQGYEVESYSDGSNRFLDIYFMPYLLKEGEVIRKPSSSINFYFNDINSIFGQPLQSGIGDIYTAPVKTADFMGYPIYGHEGQEIIAIYKSLNSASNEPLFLPVSQEEYLTALIKAEEKKQKENGIKVSKNEHLREIEKAYQKLLKIDKSAAKEFKKEMENFRKELNPNDTTKDLATSYKRELTLLSSVEKEKQAYYAIYSMEKYGNFSGLVSENDGNAQPLVKPNYRVFPKNRNNNISLIVVRWKLTNKEHSYSPRYYQPQNKFGYPLTDDILFELYHNQDIWKKIIECIK